MRINVKFTEAAKRRTHYPKNDFAATRAKGLRYTNSFVTLTYANGSDEIIRIESIESIEVTT